MPWYGAAPGLRIAALPVFVLLAAALSLGLGLLLAALTVKYRDFRYVVPFAVQLGLFISPVAFSTAQVPERWRAIYALNPMVGIIDGFRWSILGTALDWQMLALTVLITVAVARGRRMVLPPHRARICRRDLMLTMPALVRLAARW